VAIVKTALCAAGWVLDQEPDHARSPLPFLVVPWA
jgi:hypothetical protein